MEIISIILIFLVVLVALILVHEWGHFIVAKLTGMRVDEFGIGFPPKAWGIKRGETEYTINWLPIGGFVRIWGENYEDGEEGEKLTEAEQARAFSERPKWAQALVLVAGVAMNVLFAWFLFTLAFMIGMPTAIDEAEAGPDAVLTVLGTLSDGPAAALPVGAQIEEVQAGEQTLSEPTPSSFRALVNEVAPEPLTISYRYDGELTTTVLTPEQGLDTENPERYLVGLSFSMTELMRSGPVTALATGFMTTIDGLVAICVGLWSLLSSIVVGQADLSTVGGPVLIATMTGEAASFGITALMMFAAFISLNLAVVNLLPIPALDGGRLVFVAIEAVTRRPIPPEWAGRVNFVGFAFLMLLMVAVTFNDITRLL